MRYLKSAILFCLLVLLQKESLAQKNLSMEEAVLGLTTNLKVDDISQLGFQKNSSYFHMVQDTSYLLISPQFDTIKLLSLAKINALVQDSNNKLKNFPTIKWLNSTEFYFRIGQNLYTGYWSKKIGVVLNLIHTLSSNVSNVELINKDHNVLYTIDNNIYLKTKDETIAITTDSNKNIINGDAVHRHEFGINKGMFISKEGNKIAYYRMDQSMVEDYPIINWKKNPALNANIKYPMAGGITHEVSLFIYDINTKQSIKIKTPKPNKDFYLTSVTWSPDEKSIFIGVLTRDQRHLMMNEYNASSGEFIKTHFEEKHPKYVEPQYPLYFIANSNEYIHWSQRDGYMHLYRYNREGQLLNQITKGEWIVKSIEGFNAKSKEIIITTTLGDPKEVSILSVNINTGKYKIINQTKGIRNIFVSDDGNYLIDIYRNSNTPKNIDFVDIRKHKSKRILTAKNPLSNYNLSKVINTSFKTSDGTNLYGKMMLPHNFDSLKKYPVIYYLYNGPHLQLITNSFPESGNLWYDYLTQNGYIVFSMDGRGSANRGLEFEQAIHNQLGTVEMQDHLKGVEYLHSLPYVDKEKMGIYGWSYGGFMATSFMTRMPEIFKAGVAGGPVIDWKKYEIMYTERYMSHPNTNEEGYNNNNLLNYVKNLKGKLLLIHGTDDDVVVWQHSIDFIKKCVDENVQIDYFVYPGHPHNVRGKDRVHLMQKITDYFDLHLK